MGTRKVFFGAIFIFSVFIIWLWMSLDSFPVSLNHLVAANKNDRFCSVGIAPGFRGGKFGCEPGSRMSGRHGSQSGLSEQRIQMPVANALGMVLVIRF
jgi:hypothetical protein